MSFSLSSRHESTPRMPLCPGRDLCALRVFQRRRWTCPAGSGSPCRLYRPRSPRSRRPGETPPAPGLAAPSRCYKNTVWLGFGSLVYIECGRLSAPHKFSRFSVTTLCSESVQRKYACGERACMYIRIWKAIWFPRSVIAPFLLSLPSVILERILPRWVESRCAERN